MDLLFEQIVTVAAEDVTTSGKLKLSSLLRYAQEASGGHCDILGFDWDTLAAKGLFWAVLRHRVEIHRLPIAGETVTVQTWPMPATRSAYPRAVRGLDSSGNILFEVVSLWVLMNIASRAMILPGKSGVDVPGILRGDEIAAPGSLAPGNYDNSVHWHISDDDLDRNGHVNNAKYFDHVEALTGSFADTHSPRELTVCYLSETLPGQTVQLHWNLSEDGILSVDGRREKTDVPGETERVFAVRIGY